MLYDVFQAFDFADPSTPNGQRDSTTVAPQALFAMNGKLMSYQSRALAKRLLADAQVDDVGRVRAAYQRAFGREPRNEEKTAALGLVGRLEQAWVKQVADPR